MSGGLLPPPPGAKAGGLIPPPGGQQTVPAAQTNAGYYPPFCQNIFQKCPFLKKKTTQKDFFFKPDPFYSAPLLDFGSPVPAAQPSTDMWGDFTSAASK